MMFLSFLPLSNKIPFSSIFTIFILGLSKSRRVGRGVATGGRLKGGAHMYAYDWLTLLYDETLCIISNYPPI